MPGLFNVSHEWHYFTFPFLLSSWSLPSSVCPVDGSSRNYLVIPELIKIKLCVQVLNRTQGRCVNEIFIYTLYLEADT